MTIRRRICNYKKDGDNFVFIKSDTLIERLRRMRALNSTPSNIGIAQYTWKSCGFNKRKLSK